MPRLRSLPRPVALASVLLAGGAGLLGAAGLAGCGLQSDAGTAGVTITITRDFGARVLRVIAAAPSQHGLSAQSVLQHSTAAQVVAGGGVRSIDGVVAGAGERWSEFVNGVGQVDRPGNTIGPNAQVVHPGDRLWFDLHPVSAGPSLQSAVVGAFPEPFRHGIFGKRFPTTLECAADAEPACREVSGALTATGIAAPTQELGTGSGQDTVGVLVGTWADLRGTLLSTVMDAGPRASGVYARFTGGGSGLALLDAAGRVVRTLGPGAGLVAAVRDASAAPTWVITGTDLAGVRAAAGALRAAVLRNRYAVAVGVGPPIALPVAGG
jgi:hypothetical protein